MLLARKGPAGIGRHVLSPPQHTEDPSADSAPCKWYSKWSQGK
jgi:hypothetical protein